ncbi:hypothetical protein ACFQNE_04535 [Gordonia phosphorivorans]|uniref:hypothetical protein n=1 Tax=Gordonia phosphorivorans TaxID=1056982 RepID=UPI00361FD356
MNTSQETRPDQNNPSKKELTGIKKTSKTKTKFLSKNPCYQSKQNRHKKISVTHYRVLKKHTPTNTTQQKHRANFNEQSLSPVSQATVPGYTRNFFSVKSVCCTPHWAGCWHSGRATAMLSIISLGCQPLGSNFRGNLCVLATWTKLHRRQREHNSAGQRDFYGGTWPTGQ